MKGNEGMVIDLFCGHETSTDDVSGNGSRAANSAKSCRNSQASCGRMLGDSCRQAAKNCCSSFGYASDNRPVAGSPPAR